MQPLENVVLNIHATIFACHAEAIAIPFAPEVVHVLSTDDPAPMSSNLADEGIVLVFPFVTEQAILLADQDHEAVASRQIVIEPLLQPGAVGDHRIIGANAHIGIDDTNTILSKAKPKRHFNEVLRIDFGAEHIPLSLNEGALAGQNGADRLER